MREASTFACSARMIFTICAIVMAPSAATGTTGLERLLLIFLMKLNRSQRATNKTSFSNDLSSNQSVRTSQTPKNFKNTISTAKTFAETRNFTTDHRFSTKTSDSPVKNPNERRSFDLTD